jgi:hypothetical protein
MCHVHCIVRMGSFDETFKVVQSVVRSKMWQMGCVRVSLQLACSIVDAEDYQECEHTCNTVLHSCVVLLSPDSVWPH